MHVNEAMTPGLIGVPETATLWEALRKLMSARISALVVFDEAGAPVGILSEGDLLRRAEIGTQAKRPGWLDYLLGGGRAAEDYVHAHGLRISEIMTRGVISIDEGAELSEAVDLILARGVKRLVVTRRGEAVGILARSDLLKALMTHLPDLTGSRTDSQIRDAIEAEMDRQPWAPRGSVHFAVEHGVVTFEGAIIDNRLRDGLRVLAETTPGVTRVRDEIAWIEPNSGYLVPAEDAS